MINTQQNNDVKKLDTLIQENVPSDFQIKAFLSNNLGRSTLVSEISMHDFYRMSDVANERSINNEIVSQRKLDIKHATNLARYILKGLLAAAIKNNPNLNPDTYVPLQDILGKQPYLALQPMVANLRTAGNNGVNLNAQLLNTPENERIGYRIWLGQRDILWIVDGQHRRKALHLVLEFLQEIKNTQKYPPKNSLLFRHGRDERTVPPEEMAIWSECYEVSKSHCKITVDIHLGLDPLEERQLFHDLNNLGKKVETSLALVFDSSNPINQFVKEELHETGLINISSTGDIKDWNQDDGSLTRKELVAVNARLILNKTNINNAKPNEVLPRLSLAKNFWEIVAQIPGFGEEGAKSKTVVAQPVVLKALAKLVYDYAFGRLKDQAVLIKLLDGITDIDFSHDNPMWRVYDLTEQEINDSGLNGIDQFLPDSTTGNRDIGSYDKSTGWMRFGPKHNDIFPIIGDMIRWYLNLPNRHN
ncbi:DNA sulfur modification protein DndB [Paenibacillus illinoisensis]|uniref:DNA sulfur modification protein DndB n=1 Tax=Paenibacillus illinoisensis TaxID=59845 RepID=UPI003CE81DE1